MKKRTHRVRIGLAVAKSNLGLVEETALKRRQKCNFSAWRKTCQTPTKKNTTNATSTQEETPLQVRNAQFSKKREKNKWFLTKVVDGMRRSSRSLPAYYFDKTKNWCLFFPKMGNEKNRKGKGRKGQERKKEAGWSHVGLIRGILIRCDTTTPTAPDTKGWKKSFGPMVAFWPLQPTQSRRYDSIPQPEATWQNSRTAR